MENGINYPLVEDKTNEVTHEDETVDYDIYQESSILNRLFFGWAYRIVQVTF